MDLFLNILEEKDSKNLFETQPNLEDFGIDIEKIKCFFQHEQEYEGLKARECTYEQLLLQINNQLTEKNIEFTRISAEYEENLAEKNEELKILDGNLQNIMDNNIELERENQRISSDLQEKEEKLKSFEEKMKHYEDNFLVKNEEFNKNIENSNVLEEELKKLHKKFEDLQEENSNLKEKEFRNHILQDQNEEIMRTFKGLLIKASKEFSKGFENVDIREDLKRLEAENTGDFNNFMQEIERFLTATNNMYNEQIRLQTENFK